MSIELHTVDNGNVQAINDGRLYGEFTGNVGGIVNGSVVTSAGGLALHVTSGWGIGYGRVFTITADDYTVQPASSGTQKGRLYVHIDITQPANPIDIRSVAAASLPPLVQQNLSEGGAIYEIELAHYDVTALAVSNLVSNTKVAFAGHAGTADNALQLGGIDASNYEQHSYKYEQLTVPGTASLQFWRQGRVVSMFGTINLSSLGTTIDNLIGTAPFPPNHNYIIAPLYRTNPPYSLTDYGSLWIYGNGQIHLFKRAGDTGDVYVSTTYIIAD